jgi:lysozyme
MRWVTITLSLALWMVTSLAKAQSPYALSNDFSRAYLANYAASFDNSWRALPYPFSFPTNARSTSIFGIDVSHYQGEVNWGVLASQRVSFAFVKASQGSAAYDPLFTRNWRALANLKLLRGAYHFMTASDDAAAQARNFVSKVGKLREIDLPPTLDLEWDVKANDGKPVLGPDGRAIDLWAALSADAIIQKVQTWINIVRVGTGKTPIIYTNGYWWSARIGTRRDLAPYHLWIADYASKSLGAENPKTPPGADYLFWQFTDFGRTLNGGVPGHVDATIFHGSPADFSTTFGVTLPQ